MTYEFLQFFVTQFLPQTVDLHKNKSLLTIVNHILYIYDMPYVIYISWHVEV